MALALIDLDFDHLRQQWRRGAGRAANPVVERGEIAGFGNKGHDAVSQGGRRGRDERSSLRKMVSKPVGMRDETGSKNISVA